MATKVEIILIDDIDGGAADETVNFVFGGQRYAIDLSASNAAALRSVLGPYIAAGRKTKGIVAAGGRGTGGAARRSTTGMIRTWAIENGYQVSSHGKIPDGILAAFQTARA